MKALTTILLFVHALALAQSNEEMNVNSDETSISEMVFADTQPVEGYQWFKNKLETFLSGADSVGRKHKWRLDNIAFIVGKTGRIDSAWVIFDRQPLDDEIIKVLKATLWLPAEQNGAAIASRQELFLHLYLTKATLKKHDSWPSFAERVLPWVH